MKPPAPAPARVLVCPWCETRIEFDGLHFVPHDSPEWCRAAMRDLILTLRRVLNQTQEQAAWSGAEAAHFRAAYDIALCALEDRGGSVEEVEEEIERKREEVVMRENNSKIIDLGLVFGRLDSEPEGFI